MSRPTHIPIRSCVGCGQRAPQRDLLRFIGVPEGLRLDERACLPGRGAYLHRAAACWDAFLTRKPPLRSLRRSVNRTLREALVHQLRSAVTR
jgi:predicted RNA-binding protein YlxR (DUF448 family)